MEKPMHLKNATQYVWKENNISDKRCGQIMQFKVRKRDIGHATILG
jgi:hypothetical protein